MKTLKLVMIATFVSLAMAGMSFGVSPEPTDVFQAEVTDRYIMNNDTIDICKDFPKIELLEGYAPYIGTDTILVCIYDTIILDPGNGYSYVWDNHSTDQTNSIYTTGLGYDIQTHWVRAEDVGSGCFDTAWMTVVFSYAQCTGVPETDNDAVQIYPNPGNGLINVQTKSIQGDVILEVLDLNGQLKYKTSYTIAPEESTQPIDLSKLSDGAYLIRIVGDDFIQTEKVIKQ